MISIAEYGLGDHTAIAAAGTSGSTASSQCMTFVNPSNGSRRRIEPHLDHEIVPRVATRFVGDLPCSRDSDLQHAQTVHRRGSGQRGEMLGLTISCT